jgi:conjugal transfer mating pair stabilization protein TraN
MECKKPGAVSAWKNCCKNKGDAIYFDSQGSSVESTLTNKALLATLQAAGAAISAAASAASAGATAAQASQAGAEAATSSLQGAFDPTSLAIAIAVALIMDFLANACDQMDMETGMLSASGFCVETGEYCKERWKHIGCVQKNKTFCCFNSKLARIFHQQGRKQLKTFTGNQGFGTPNAPNCRGFTPEEFQSLDFSKIDLTEYIGEMTLKSTAVIGNEVEQKANEYMDKTDPN